MILIEHLTSKKNIILGEKLSPDRQQKKEVKHTIIEFGLYRGLIIIAILAVLNHFGPLSKKQLQDMVGKKLAEKIPYTKINNMLRLLSLWSYIGKERVTRRIFITEKGKAIFEKSKNFISKLVSAITEKDFLNIYELGGLKE